MDLRQGLLWLGIGAITASGLIAAAIVLFGLEVIFLILNDFKHVTDFAVRLMWALTIFGVMGSLLLPLIKKLTSKEATIT